MASRRGLKAVCRSLPLLAYFMHYAGRPGGPHKLAMDLLAALAAPFRRLWPAERKSLAAPSADLLALFGGVTTSSGGVLGLEGMLKVPAVSAAIRVIADAAASLDVSVKEIGADGVETDAPDHPATPFLQGAVNDWTSAAELIRDLTSDALLRDLGGLALVTRNPDGRIVEAIRYAPGAIGVDYDPSTLEPTYRDASGRPLRSGDVIHLRPPFGRAPATLARDAIAAAAAMERHAATLFDRGARPSGTLNFTKPMGEETIRKAIAGWKAAQEGADNAGRTAFLFDGVEFNQIALTSTDAQFLENRTFQILEVARAFRVPPSMLYELTRATWSNTEQMGREFLSYTLEPWLRSLEAALGRALFLPEERQRFRVRFDRDDLTRADLATRATTISSLIASRVLSPNEGRSWLGLPPREGGDAFENPHVAERTGAAAPQPAPQEDTDGPE